MKKIYFTFLVLVFILSACTGPKNFKSGQSDYENRFDDNPNQKTDIEMYNEDQNQPIPDCHTLCYDKIQELCMDDIVELLSDGNIMDASMYNEEGCETICNKWTDDTKRCIGKATKCESLSQEEPYCKDEGEDIVEYIEDKENTKCSSACYKYKRCVLLSDDVSLVDANEAYTTCYGECQNWTKETIMCMNNTETGTAMGCMKHSQCGLAEYKGMIESLK